MVCATMEFVGRSAWRIIKMIAGFLTAIGAILVFTKVPCNVDIVKYIVAAVMLICALAVLIDSLGVEALLNKFRVQIQHLHDEIGKLVIIEQGLTNTNNDLKKRNTEYTDLNTEYSSKLKTLHLQLATQANNNTEQSVLIGQMRVENEKLEKFNKNAKNVIDQILMTGDTVEAANKTLESLLHEITVDKFDQIDTDGNQQIDNDEFLTYALHKRQVVRGIKREIAREIKKKE